jgi:hypothetical protein
MTITTSEVESHPFLHEFTVVNDVIMERNSRRVPVIIKREERCDYCNTRRFTRIDVMRWMQVGSRQYKYPPGLKIVRIAKPVWLKQQFMNSTTLVTDDSDAYRALM